MDTKMITKEEKSRTKLEVLKYLAQNQGQWNMIWDIFDKVNPKIPWKLKLDIMRNLHRRGLVGGCPCGCRGDFDITDKGLLLIGEVRVKPYEGY